MTIGLIMTAIVAHLALAMIAARGWYRLVFKDSNMSHADDMTWSVVLGLLWPASVPITLTLYGFFLIAFEAIPALWKRIGGTVKASFAPIGRYIRKPLPKEPTKKKPTTIRGSYGIPRYYDEGIPHYGSRDDDE